jgi:hypothetical protein
LPRSTKQHAAEDPPPPLEPPHRHIRGAGSNEATAAPAYREPSEALSAQTGRARCARSRVNVLCDRTDVILERIPGFTRLYQDRDYELKRGSEFESRPRQGYEQRGRRMSTREATRRLWRAIEACSDFDEPSSLQHGAGKGARRGARKERGKATASTLGVM